MNSFDVITVGNALLDVFLTIQEDNIHSRLRKVEQELCFKYGEKIHVDACEFQIGGNACNVAVGLSRLPLRTALCAEIGDDVFSQKIVNILSREPIDRSLVVKSKGTPASFAIGVNYSGERTLFVEHVKRNHEFNLKDVSCKWIYLTSLGAEWKVPYQHVLDYVKEKGANLAFSPGTHQLESFHGKTRSEDGKAIVLAAIKNAQILFVNKQEGQTIGETNENNMDKLIVQLKNLGPKIVVVTDGINGSFSLDSTGKIYRLEIFPSTVVERTGAGDAYAAGFLGAILFGKDVSEAMQWGAVNAASVVEKIGAQPGLLSRKEIEKKLNFSVRMV